MYDRLFLKNIFNLTQIKVNILVKKKNYTFFSPILFNVDKKENKCLGKNNKKKVKIRIINGKHPTRQDIKFTTSYDYYP